MQYLRWTSHTVTQSIWYSNVQRIPSCQHCSIRICCPSPCCSQAATSRFSNIDRSKSWVNHRRVIRKSKIWKCRSRKERKICSRIFGKIIHVTFMFERTTVQSINHSDFDPPKPLKKINLVINKTWNEKYRCEGESGGRVCTFFWETIQMIWIFETNQPTNNWYHFFSIQPLIYLIYSTNFFQCLALLFITWRYNALAFDSFFTLNLSIFLAKIINFFCIQLNKNSNFSTSFLSFFACMKEFLKFERRRSRYNVQPIFTLDLNKNGCEIILWEQSGYVYEVFLLSCKSLTPNKPYSTTTFSFSPRKSDGINYPGQFSWQSYKFTTSIIKKQCQLKKAWGVSSLFSQRLQELNSWKDMKWNEGKYPENWGKMNFCRLSFYALIWYKSWVGK